MKRQRVRKLLLVTALLLFPVTMWYFSPYLILNAAVRHIINGSFIVFVLMFVLSAFFGRIWCATCCPTGGLQECAFLITDKEPKLGWRNRAKYVVWGVWLSALAVCWILGRGNVKINFFFMTDHGISISSIYLYIIYYGIIILFLVPAVCAGKRAACHYFCWMAPFMIFGSKTGRLLRFPHLHMKADADKCVSCGKCRKVCPMSIDVPEHVRSGQIRDDECIQCGACADTCPNTVIHYSLSRTEA